MTPDPDTNLPIIPADHRLLDEIFYRAVVQSGSGVRDDEPFLQIIARYRLGLSRGS